MAELEYLIANRTFLTGLLAAIGIAIAFGPEIRLAVSRIRREARESRADISAAGARVG